MAFSGNECHSEQENIFISAPERRNSGKIHFEIEGGGQWPLAVNNRSLYEQ